MQELKNDTFSDILQNEQNYCFAIAIILRLNPFEIAKKYKIEAL
jgi:hypothetical protein